jgi:hypothetical protein
MDAIIENWDKIGTNALAIFGAISIIVRLTPTKEDDKVVGKIGKILILVFQRGRKK